MIVPVLTIFWDAYPSLTNLLSILEFSIMSTTYAGCELDVAMRIYIVKLDV